MASPLRASNRALSHSRTQGVEGSSIPLQKSPGCICGISSRTIPNVASV